MTTQPVTREPISQTVSPCPHCGNRDIQFREWNGERGEFAAWLCTAPVLPEDSSFVREAIDSEQIDANGTTPCGMQWDREFLRDLRDRREAR